MELKHTRKLENLITIGCFSQGIEAHLAKTRLESEGIECFIRDENTINVNWLYSNAIGGVKLQVRQSDSEKAKKIFSHFDEIPSHNKTDSEAQQRCPKCNSIDIRYEKFARKPAFWSWILLGIPLPFVKRKWKCNTCGYSWKQL
ncbi:MAG: DUF2007 domain-containing protein [Candidatus Latescibacteria bacterium]|nr:DUF2007 domain-containing protein [Candidatus Latescibacterota bacterium]